MGLKTAGRRPRGKIILAVLSLSLVFCLLFSGSALARALLKKGSRGADVVTVQQELQNAGYSLGVDGIFGEETRRAVLDFQRAHKLKVSGKVDDKTWAALQQYQEGRPDGSGVLKGRRVLVKETAPFVPQSEVQGLLAAAKKYMGVRYVFGGTTPKGGFDCSGYVQYVFRERGYSIPRTADIQFEIGKKTSSSRELVPGDLVFFTTYEPGASHVGIYLGNTKFIHASSSRGVTISSLNDEYYKQRYYGGKKVVISDGKADPQPAMTEKEARKKQKAEEKARLEAEEKRQAEAEARRQAEAQRAEEAKRREEEARRKTEAPKPPTEKAQPAQPGKSPAPTDAPKQKPAGTQAPKPEAAPPAKPAAPVKENNPNPMGQHKSR